MELEKKEFLEEYKTLTETSPDCIKLIGLEGDLKYINPGGLKEHGFKNINEAINQNWKISGTLEDSYVPIFENAFQEALQGKINTIELKHKKGTSDRNFCLETIAPVKNEEGKVIAIFGVSRDISNIKKTEEELKKMKENLEVMVINRTTELNNKVEELEKLNEIMLGREHKMIELKKKIKELQNELDFKTY